MFYPTTRFSHYAKSLYRSVDFFFLLSGFLLFRSFSTRRSENALDYTFSKIKRFLPLNIVVIIITCVFTTIEPVTSINKALNIFQSFIVNLLCAIPNFLFLQLFIPVYENFLPTQSDWFAPLWYISALLVSGFLWYWILLFLQKKHEEKSNYHAWGLVAAIFIYCYLLQQYGQLNISLAFAPIFNISTGFLRGFAGMGLGIFCANYKFELKTKKILKIAKVILPFFLLGLAFYAKATTIDFIFVFATALVLLFEFSLTEEPKKIIKKICIFLNKSCLPLYFSHAIVIVFEYTALVKHFPSLRENLLIDIIIRIILVFSTAFAVHWLTKPITKLLDKFYSHTTTITS